MRRWAHARILSFELWILKNTGSFSFEFMGGGRAVVCGYDSYFWVVTNFTGMDPQDGYRTQTLMTLVVGIVSMLAIFLASLILL